MLVLTLILWLMSIILIISDYKTISTRWGSAIAFFSGFSGIGVFLREEVIVTCYIVITDLVGNTWNDIKDLTGEAYENVKGKMVSNVGDILNFAEKTLTNGMTNMVKSIGGVASSLLSNICKVFILDFM